MSAILNEWVNAGFKINGRKDAKCVFFSYCVWKLARERKKMCVHISASVAQELYLAIQGLTVIFSHHQVCIKKNTSSTARLFADDCLLYRTINCEADATTLQKDLDTMQQWKAKWLMEFNPDKCEVITITNKRSKPKLEQTH